MADDVTSRGCTTFSSSMSVMVPLRTLMPYVGLPVAVEVAQLRDDLHGV